MGRARVRVGSSPLGETSVASAFLQTERRRIQGGGGCWSTGWDREGDTRCHSKQCPSLLRPGLELKGQALRLSWCSGGGGSWRERVGGGQRSARPAGPGRMLLTPSERAWLGCICQECAILWWLVWDTSEGQPYRQWVCPVQGP